MELGCPLIRHYLKNVLFINGTACAGKSTMARLLAETYGLLLCGENYGCVPEGLISPETHPNLCYFQTMQDWQEFIHRTPRQYSDWIAGCSRELAQFEIAHLMGIPRERRVIVDTNIPADILREIAGYHQVAVMLAPPELSAGHFFDRDDPEKLFIREEIMRSRDPEAAMDNFLACIAAVNSRENYDSSANSGFFTVVRRDASRDTRAETLTILAKHFGLTE